MVQEDSRNLGIARRDNRRRVKREHGFVDTISHGLFRAEKLIELVVPSLVDVGNEVPHELRHFDRLLQLCPTGEAILAGDKALSVGKLRRTWVERGIMRGGQLKGKSVGGEEIAEQGFSLVAKMSEIGPFGQLVSQDQTSVATGLWSANRQATKVSHSETDARSG